MGGEEFPVASPRENFPAMSGFGYYFAFLENAVSHALVFANPSDVDSATFHTQQCRLAWRGSIVFRHTDFSSNIR